MATITNEFMRQMIYKTKTYSIVSWTQIGICRALRSLFGSMVGEIFHFVKMVSYQSSAQYPMVAT